MPYTPEDFTPSQFFEKYITNFLPPIYKTEALRIERRHGIPFTRHWAYEWEMILKDMNKKPSPEALYFRGRQEYQHYSAVDLVLSEVYRSAYLRALAWALSTNAIALHDATYLAAKTCPIDPVLWKVKPIARPDWWPQVPGPSGVVDTTLSEIWQQVEDVWIRQQDSKNDWVIAQANGRVYEGDILYELEIQSCFQKCLGPQRPELSDIMNWHESRKLVAYVPLNMGFEGIIQEEDLADFVGVFRDWQILPVACQVWPYTTPRWQFWRLERGIWLPAPFVSHDHMQFSCVEDAIHIYENGNMMAKWSDWVCNLREKSTANLKNSTGEFLLINKPKIVAFTEERNCSFCWICKLTHFHRDHTFENYKEFSDFQSYGTSSVIIA